MTRKGSWRHLFGDAIYYGFAFGVANIVGYVYLVVAGRVLAKPDFAVFNTLLGMLTMASFFAASIQVAVTRAASHDPGLENFSSTMRRTWAAATTVTALVVVVAIPFAPSIGANWTGVVMTGLVVVTTFAACAASGFMIGIGLIRIQGGLNALGTFFRLAGWPLMLLGLGVSGAICGYLANQVVLAGLALLWTRAHVTARASTGAAAAPREKIPIDWFHIAVYVAGFAPFTIDQLLVQSFNQSLGGDYAALATIAKVVFYAAYPVMAVVYPHLLAQRDSTHRIRLIAIGALAVCLIGFGLALAMGAAPQKVVELFFAHRFDAAVPYVGSLTLGVACFALSALGVHVLIALGSRWGFWPSLVSVALGVVLYAVHHDSLSAIIQNQMTVYAVQLGLVVVHVLAVMRASSGRTAEQIPWAP